ncbi:hypothetical protein ES703_78494 [subsurface metagenome]
MARLCLGRQHTRSSSSLCQKPIETDQCVLGFRLVLSALGRIFEGQEGCVFPLRLDDQSFPDQLVG